MEKDIWQIITDKAKKEDHPEKVSPFISSHHVACALDEEYGEIYTGFRIEGASEVIAFCRKGCCIKYVYTKWSNNCYRISFLLKMAIQMKLVLYTMWSM